MALLMGDGYNLDVGAQAIDQRIRVPTWKNVLATTMSANRPSLRRFDRGNHRLLKSQQKGARRQWTPLGIPITRVLGIIDGFGMPAWLTRSHRRGVF